MRYEPHKAFSRSRPVAAPCGLLPVDDLPPEIAFLRTYFVDETALQKAARDARRAKTCAVEALLAGGGVSAALYYRALAAWLDLRFIGDWPQIEPDLDPAAAHRIRCIRLVDDPRGQWLAAPCGTDLQNLLEARRLGITPRSMAITTPTHLSAIVLHRASTAVEFLACEALPRAAPRFSAKGAVTSKVIALVGLALLFCLLGPWLAPRFAGGLFGLLFLAATIFRLLVCAAGLPPDALATEFLDDAELPFYTVLVPLHGEAGIVPALLDRLCGLDYPRAKLEVLVLVEPEDRATRAALASAKLPPWFRIVVAPDKAGLRTKPRALNIGLAMARGTLLTVYDAEDHPAPDQLRHAASAFRAKPESVVCLQARLAMKEAPGLLPRLFAVEYAALFDLYNIGIVRSGLPLALGGTSNHFRTAALRSVGGWDAWNVTEDADLGLRLARLGYDVGALDSTTVEIAPTKVGVWMKQRRRWTKGWMQTFLVLACDASALPRQMGRWRCGAVGLMAVNLVAGPLLLPMYSGLLAFNVLTFGLAHPRGPMEVLEATLAVSVLLLGIGAIVWPAYAGMRKRLLGRAPILLPLVLLYQLMISAAAMMGLWDLIKRPYHWHKTPH